MRQEAREGSKGGRPGRGGLVCLSAPFAEILLETHSLFHGVNLNVLNIA